MRRISKSFGGVRALEEVSFDLQGGEVHVVAGENGAGKSTLIKILSGVHSQYDGEITLRGQPVCFKSPHDAARQGVTTIHQEMSLVNSMSVIDNVFLGYEPTRAGSWLDRPRAHRKTEQVLRRLGLDLNLDQPAGEYSTAIRQLIEIAKALIRESTILVMDEPTSALNDPEAERLFSIVGDLRRRGCGIVYISHRLEEIYRLADRITVLRDGQHVSTCPAAELDRDDLIRRMVGREIAQQYPVRRPRLGSERLEVRGLWVPDPSQAKRWAVEEVSFLVRAGEILGVAGLHGSGKTELLNGLFGAYGHPPRGSVLLDGRPVALRSPQCCIRSGLALLTSDRKGTGLVPAGSISDNITLASLRAFSPRGWIKPRHEWEVTRHHMQSLWIQAAGPDQEVSALSGGNQQKVLLARWLQTGPRVLLLDEPTRGIDVGAKHEIYELMNQWTAAGVAVVLVTSEMPELLAMSDRILVMHRGRLVSQLPRLEATQQKVLAAAMGERTDT